MSDILKALAADAPTATNAAGGKQSTTPVRLDCLPPLAILAVGAVLKHGAEKYGDKNWHKIPVNEHVNHALAHIMAHLEGDKGDTHLSHAACRLLFALDLAERGSDARAEALYAAVLRFVREPDFYWIKSDVQIPGVSDAAREYVGNVIPEYVSGQSERVLTPAEDALVRFSIAEALRLYP